MRLALAFAALALPAAAQQATVEAALPDTAFPTDFGGEYALVDHHGQPRDHTDPDGRIQLIFFGYANCQAICTVALPIMAEMTAALAANGIAVAPLVITVDPARDTVETMGPALARHAPGLTGLTGSEAELARARAAFHVERTALFEEPLGGTVYAHGSHIFVMDGDGGFLTLLPPILSTERMVEIVAGYAAG
ncbi:SCO family protein [Jannaschia ovalis]|uniref:SCO family protein n=1 Tax=Jannaschia ovalis TaxID=3038773 RepID=A0ABY8LCG2_9RHOB|nr:SCO family protein [Jannaschia sp. GRR-S6-38]WGH77735.1 SCO family protein [Jannaschia sp. GRR-S6-38]